MEQLINTKVNQVTAHHHLSDRSRNQLLNTPILFDYALHPTLCLPRLLAEKTNMPTLTSVAVVGPAKDFGSKPTAVLPALLAIQGGR